MSFRKPKAQQRSNSRADKLERAEQEVYQMYRQMADHSEKAAQLWEKAGTDNTAISLNRYAQAAGFMDQAINFLSKAAAERLETIEELEKPDELEDGPE